MGDIDLKKRIIDLKKAILIVTTNAGRGHVTSCFSSVELLAVLYYCGYLKKDPDNPAWDERDYFILSKGHADALIYGILSDLGYFDKEKFNKYCLEGSEVGPLLRGDVPGVEVLTGSLGCGLGIAVGIAMSLKIDNGDNKVFCLVGDAECEEGSIWESAGLAVERCLDNLIVIVDDNHMGATRFIPSNSKGEDGLEQKWAGFGFETKRIDGHNVDDIKNAYEWALKQSRPSVIIADTIKGNGVSFITNEPFMHGVAVSPDRLADAIAEVEGSAIR